MEALPLFLLGATIMTNCAISATVSTSSPVQLLGKEADGVTLRMTPGTMKLQVCDARTIRVIYSPVEQIPATRSFVITHTWEPVPFSVEEGAQVLRVSTGEVKVEVNRQSGVLRFADRENRTLLQETPEGSRVLTPAQVNGEKTYHVQQTFQSPADEVLWGLGQYQDGLWNWRGIPLELRQLNTQIALPMLISSKGYGLLWDNASFTDFNPVDREIALDGQVAASAQKQPQATEDLAKTPMDVSKLGKKTGVFTTAAGGEYVFFAKDGDRRGDFAILIDGKQVAGVTNMWTPYSLSARVTLPANTTVTVGLRGGGPNTKLFARPVGDTTTFRSRVGEVIDYTFFYGPELDAVVAGYRKATGAAPMWPRWAYGFWQCRERYSSQQQILDTVAEFRRRQIPMDLLVQDWQYWGPHGWGAYQWDEKPYPDPAAMLQAMHDQHARFMISVWCNPHGQAGETLKQSKGLVGEWVDVFSPQARALRWKLINEAFYSKGTDAWWGDATEPGDPGNDLDRKRTFAGSGDRVRNAYPLFASQSLYEGQRAEDSSKRVCILTRSAYPGMQRYAAAAWSGDVNGNWETFRRQIPAGLNFCLAGIPYWTTDCGGFFHPHGQYQSADYNELLARWFQWSTFCPILRIHGFQSETEMWKYLPQTQKVLLAYDQLRYRLLPYTYSVAWRTTDQAYTMMRALPMDFAGDPKVLGISDEYLFGPAFLVAPVTSPAATSRRVYLPASSEWVNFWTGERVAGGQEIDAPAPLEILPTFVRAGSIVPMGPVVQYADEQPDAPIELRVYPGTDGSFTLYEDEGDNYNYEKGLFATTAITWNERTQTLTLGPRRGQFPGMAATREFHVVLVRPGVGAGMEVVARPDRVIRYTGATVQWQAGR